jgi:hypothetical protein
MRNLLQWLKSKLRHKQPELLPPLLSKEQAEEIAAALQPLPLQPKGHVVKSTRPAEYNPTASRKGGRVVKAMPRSLQKIKAAQEKVEDDDNM